MRAPRLASLAQHFRDAPHRLLYTLVLDGWFPAGEFECGQDQILRHGIVQIGGEILLLPVLGQRGSEASARS